MNQRALLIAFVTAAVSLVLLLLYVHQFEQEMSGGERVKLLMAVKPLERGTLLTDDMLGTREVPMAYVEARAIKASERPKVIGVRVSNAVQAQDVLIWTDLAVGSEERDLSALVQPGSRAVTVRATNPDDTKGNALIRPGDYVDVLATMEDLNHAPGTPETRSSVVLLQKVLVLAVGLDTEPQASAALGTPTQPARVSQYDMLLTLNLNLPEAQLLALGSEKGRLSVAVRNPDDQRVIEGIPDMASNALFDSKARAEIQSLRRVNSAAAGPIKIQSAGAVR